MGAPVNANRELFAQIKTHILEEPRRLNMGYWTLGQNEISSMLTRDRQPPCGTVGCIAGWAVMLTNPENKAIYLEHASQVAPDAEVALGLTGHEATVLFIERMWPMELRNKLNDYDSGTLEYAQVVCDRIDHFLATGE